MSFCTSQFALFFLYVLALYTFLPKRASRLVLLSASYLFYGYWNWYLLGLIWISTVTAHYGALAIHREDDDARRHRYVVATIVLNLGILGLFKYYNFFAGSLNDLLTTFGVKVSVHHLQLLLPVGISFYTFQAIGYVVDVYRRKAPAEPSLFNTALFVAFFPQLVAGPIERVTDLMPQLKAERRQSYEGLSAGLYLIFAGVFKKVFIADNLAFFTERVFDQTDPTVNGTLVLLGLYAFAFQIYCDFSGYTDIARGVARCLGMTLSMNFNLPYFATSPQDLWRRWHITLSQWLRDYLYIPLGGSRGDRFFTGRNLFLTMLLGGLWHGAAWTFVAWGAFHGLILIVHREFRHHFPPKGSGVDDDLTLFQWGWRVVLMFHMTCISWLFFRANSIGQAWDFLVMLVTDHGYTAEVGMYAYYVLFFAWPLIGYQLWQQWRKREVVITDLPIVVRSVIYVGALAALSILSASDNREFIYFQF